MCEQIEKTCTKSKIKKGSRFLRGLKKILYCWWWCKDQQQDEEVDKLLNLHGTMRERELMVCVRRVTP